MKYILIYILIPFYSPSTFSQNVLTSKYIYSETEAKTLVQKVLDSSPVIDGHNDLFVHFFDCKTCPRSVQDYRIDTLSTGHTDIPRLRKGKVGALLINVSAKDTSLLSYHRAWDLLYSMEEFYHKDLKIVGSSVEMRNAMKAGKIAMLPILEGSLQLKDAPALLRTFYKLGLRSVTFAYKTNGLADGSDDTIRNNGISDKGRLMVKEMNRLGVLIDMSHISAKSMHDILDVTQAPVIFSHSNAKALTDANRNVPGDVLQRLKQNKGIIMLTLVPYLPQMNFMAG